MPWIEELRSLNWSQAGFVVIGAYFLGCFTTGYYLVRWRTGEDLRQIGSGTVGARNVGRLLGRPGFSLALLGDFGKGTLAVWLTLHFTADSRLAVMAMLAVVAGHIWPVQLRFRGGKGMATSLGALLIYDPRLALPFLLLFCGGWIVLRKTMLPGLFALACLPIVHFYLQRSMFNLGGVSLLAGMVLLAHRKNIVSEISHMVNRDDIEPQENPPVL